MNLFCVLFELIFDIYKKNKNKNKKLLGLSKGFILHVAYEVKSKEIKFRFNNYTSVFNNI